MGYLSPFLFAGLVLLNFCGCGTSGMNDGSLDPIVFGVVNQFPDHPNYLKEKTFTAMHQNTIIETLLVKDQLFQVVKQFLTAKGYRVIAADNNEVLRDGRADMVIEIVPRNVFKRDGAFGYGFADRNFLLGLIKNKPHSYVAMELKMSRKNSMRIITTKKEERFSAIGIDAMPDQWTQLTKDEKERFKKNLQENIAKTADLLLLRFKI